nr:hypothetical protein [Candidatus Enterousia merdequi]
MHKKVIVFLMLALVFQSGLYAASKSGKQQDVFGGTKITEAGTNSLVDSECSDSYFSCMDAFCVVDNVSGGRCQCSNKHIELSKQFDELLAKDEQAESMAQYGADFVKLGKVENDIMSDIEKAKTKQPTVSQSTGVSRADWDAMFMTQEPEDDEEEFVDTDDVSNKHGDELYIEADKMCLEQTPAKCKAKDISEMFQMMYAQKIKSDCAAFENAIKQKDTEVFAKLSDAQKAVRSAALEEFNNENKYDLGQCAIEFRDCMKTTGGCGDDFVGCVGLAGNNNLTQSTVLIEGDLTSTAIYASTMDTLLSKKVLCDHVLDNCEKVRDNVWNTFLKDNVFAIKQAESNSEHNLRTSCIGNISECFAKSCREHFDVNDEDGSYDMCLSRPENYKSFCKIELDPCLNATGGSYEEPLKSVLWQGVLAKLSAMRVDACTNEFKSCIQDKDRCGEDLSQCIGLDYYDIVDVCPQDKLTACYKEYDGNKETVEDTLARLSQGLMLGVSNNLYDACQKAVSDAMLKYCGNEENCNDFIVRDKVGERTLEIKYCERVNGEYVNCKQDISQIMDTELGKTVRNSDLSKTKNDIHRFFGVVTGQIFWEYIDILPDYAGITSGDDYLESLGKEYNVDPKVKDKIRTEVGSLSNAIKNTIAMIESDPKVQYCMTGRQVDGLTSDNGFQQVIGKGQNQMFPNLTQSVRAQIIHGALLTVQNNYNKKNEEIMDEYFDTNAKLDRRYAEVEKENAHLDEQDIARKKCMDLGERANFNTDDFVASMKKKGSGKTASATKKVVSDHGNDGKLVGWSSESMWNYKIHVTTTFSLDKMICTKCVRTQECKTLKSNHCKNWKDETETCSEVEY